MTPGIMWMGAINPPVWYGKELEPVELFKLLRGMGAEAIDIFARTAEQHGAETLAQALREADLRCSCYYISADLVSGEPDKVAAADEAFPRGIEMAQALSAPICFTHGSQHAHAGEENLQLYIERLREKVRLFQGTGMTLVIENAGTLLHAARDMLRVMDALADEGLRLCPDTGNFTMWRQDEVEAIEMLLPYSVHYHIKDFGELWEEEGRLRGRETVLGEGVTPVEEIIGMLKEAEWEGVLAWEPGPQDEAGVEQSVRQLLEYMQ
jgi:sugar phosphate isomerase/epimerase